MLKKLFITALFFANLALQGCNSANSQSSNSETTNLNREVEISNNKVKIETPQPPKDEISNRQNVDFKGVSFTYNPQIWGEVQAEEVAERPLENETDKPDYVAPRHILFKWKKSEQNRETTISIFPIEDYRRMYPASTKYSYQKQFEENLKSLKKIIANKKFRVKNEIPFIPFYDAHQTFEAKVKHFSFGNGKGLFCLTQFTQDYDFVNNGHLTYFFQGISEDGKKYILAEFPVIVSFLPENYHVGEFEGYSIPDNVYRDKIAQKTYAEYLAKITKRLEDLPPDKYEPNLNYLEEIISSLKIEK